ncbi:hypothetical protein NDU88_005636 [Pleurodeles waltl]|uniref:Uncharacterized protein n=1 Tax=Pleurodeles waltl TaxID=8319 RepID=A0AAV7TUI1_PLEWA|nr:hypothetical protein NDU88_005636 [Pleurodeles waltl]
MVPLFRFLGDICGMLHCDLSAQQGWGFSLCWSCLSLAKVVIHSSRQATSGRPFPGPMGAPSAGAHRLGCFLPTQYASSSPFGGQLLAPPPSLGCSVEEAHQWSTQGGRCPRASSRAHGSSAHFLLSLSGPRLLQRPLLPPPALATPTTRPQQVHSPGRQEGPSSGPPHLIGHLFISRRVHAASAAHDPGAQRGSCPAPGTAQVPVQDPTPQLLLPCLARVEIGVAVAVPRSTRESQPHRWRASRGFLQRFLSTAPDLTSTLSASVAARGSSLQFPVALLYGMDANIQLFGIHIGSSRL